jgi:hypothetical protein
MRKKSASAKQQPEFAKPTSLNDLLAPGDVRVNELLETAGIPSGNDTNCDLWLALYFARRAAIGEQEHQDQPTEKDLSQLERSVANTIGYVRRLKKYAYTKYIGWQVHPLKDDFTGDIFYALCAMKIEGELVHFPEGSPPQVQSGAVQPPRIPDPTFIYVNIEKLLCNWQGDIKKLVTRRRARPKRQDIYYVVFYAAEFFYKYSLREPSNDVNNPFNAFAEQFYEIVIGTRPTRSLDRQIRNVLKRLKSRSACSGL